MKTPSLDCFCPASRLDCIICKYLWADFFASQRRAVVPYASMHSLCSVQVCIVCMCSTSWCSVHAGASMFVRSYVMGCTRVLMISGMLLCIQNESSSYNANYSNILCKCFAALYRVSQKNGAKVPRLTHQ